MEERLDLSETVLLKRLTDDRNPALQLTAAIFYLKTKGKHRGYTERIEQTGRDGGPIDLRAMLDLRI